MSLLHWHRFFGKPIADTLNLQSVHHSGDRGKDLLVKAVFSLAVEGRELSHIYLSLYLVRGFFL